MTCCIVIHRGLTKPLWHRLNGKFEQEFLAKGSFSRGRIWNLPPGGLYMFNCVALEQLCILCSTSLFCYLLLGFFDCFVVV